jgi:hypothetical protein
MFAIIYLLGTFITDLLKSRRLSLSETPYGWPTGANRVMLLPMIQLLRLLCGALIGVFQSSARREAEILVLRQQINVLRRKSPKRPAVASENSIHLTRSHRRIRT